MTCERFDELHVRSCELRHLCRNSRRDGAALWFRHQDPS